MKIFMLKVYPLKGEHEQNGVDIIFCIYTKVIGSSGSLSFIVLQIARRCEKCYNKNNITTEACLKNYFKATEHICSFYYTNILCKSFKCCGTNIIVKNLSTIFRQILKM